MVCAVLHHENFHGLSCSFDIVVYSSEWCVVVVSVYSNMHCAVAVLWTLPMHDFLGGLLSCIFLLATDASSLRESIHPFPSRHTFCKYHSFHCFFLYPNYPRLHYEENLCKGIIKWFPIIGISAASSHFSSVSSYLIL